MFVPFNLLSAKDAFFTASIIVPILTLSANFLDNLLNVEVSIDRKQDAETLFHQSQEQTFDFIIGENKI